MPEPAARSAPSLPIAEWMAPLPPASRLIFHGGDDARKAAAAVFKAPFPEEACRASVSGARACLWLGPDEYLLLAPAEESAAAIAASVDAALAAIPHSCVDVSHRQVGVEIFGPQAAPILNGACPLDLDEAQFPVGACTRTVFAKAEIVLWRTRPDAFRIEVWRSFSGYVTELLTEIARTPRISA